MEEIKKYTDENGRTWYRDENGREYCYRVRKLTPRECFRLMGVREPDIDTLLKCGISKTQLYKLAGNSIVVDQLVYLLLQLFSPNKKKEPKQLNLFQL